MTSPNQARQALQARLIDAPRAVDMIDYPLASLLESACFLALDKSFTLERKRALVIFSGDEPGTDELQKLDFWISTTTSHYAREQETLGPVGQRRFTVPGALFLRLFVKLKLSAAYAMALKTEEGVPGSGLPTAGFVADCLFRDIVGVFSGARLDVESITRKSWDPDTNFNVLVEAPTFHENGVDAGWLRSTVEVPFSYDQRG